MLRQRVAGDRLRMLQSVAHGEELSVGVEAFVKAMSLAAGPHTQA